MPPLQHKASLQEDPLISLLDQGLAKMEAHILTHVALKEKANIFLIYF